MATTNIAPGSSTSPHVLSTAPWAQQPGRAGTPTSTYSNTNSPLIGTSNSPTHTTSSSPQIGVAIRSTSPTISPISPNSLSHSSFPSSQHQITPPGSPTTSTLSGPISSHNQTAQHKSTNFILSKWGIGWETPTIMVSCYLLGKFLCIAKSSSSHHSQS